MSNPTFKSLPTSFVTNCHSKHGDLTCRLVLKSSGVKTFLPHRVSLNVYSCNNYSPHFSDTQFLMFQVRLQ